MKVRFNLKDAGGLILLKFRYIKGSLPLVYSTRQHIEPGRWDKKTMRAAVKNAATEPHLSDLNNLPKSGQLNNLNHLQMIYKGILGIDDYGCLKCGDSYLVEDVEEHFKKGDNVSVRYYLTDKEVTEEETKKALILNTIGGNVDELEFILDAYSEFSILELQEHLVIGGHDLYAELQDCEGKFLTLVIEAATEIK